MPVPEWNAEIITPESESGMPPLATNGGLGTNAQDELEVKVDGSTITVNGDGELEALGGGTTYTAGNMISLANDAIAVSTTAGITDIQQVAALPASPVSTVIYLIPET